MRGSLSLGTSPETQQILECRLPLTPPAGPFRGIVTGRGRPGQLGLVAWEGESVGGGFPGVSCPGTQALHPPAQVRSQALLFIKRMYEKEQLREYVEKFALNYLQLLVHPNPPSVLFGADKDTGLGPLIPRPQEQLWRQG